MTRASPIPWVGPSCSGRRTSSSKIPRRARLRPGPSRGVGRLPPSTVPAGHKPAGTLFAPFVSCCDRRSQVMDFSKRQSDPRRHIVGLTFVILFHALIVYALVTGLAKKVVEVVRAPIETKVIEEIK